MTRPSPATVAGVLLAAGAGVRHGGPKALVAGARSPWVVEGVQRLRAGGCADVVVVVGAAGEEVRSVLAQVDDPPGVVDAQDWRAGMGASLRAGLGALAGGDHAAALVHLVDLPDVGADVVARFVPLATTAVLARAGYGPDAEPGHPVLLGRDHWPGVLAAADGDRGARDYLARHEVAVVDCSDLATGHDVDVR